MNQIAFIFAAFITCIMCCGDCEAKPYRLHPVDSTAYSVKVALDSIVIPGSRRRILVVTRKYAPGVMPEFHYEPDTTGLIYVYRRNAREIVFEDHDGPLLGQEIILTQYCARNMVLLYLIKHSKIGYRCLRILYR